MKKEWLKRSCCCLFFLSLLCSCFLFTDVRAETVTRYFGDVNGNGRIDEDDAHMIRLHIAAQNSEETAEKNPDWILEGIELEAADANRSGEIDLGDEQKVKRHIMAEDDDAVYEEHPDWIISETFSYEVTDDQEEEEAEVLSMEQFGIPYGYYEGGIPMGDGVFFAEGDLNSDGTFRMQSDSEPLFDETDEGRGSDIFTYSGTYWVDYIDEAGRPVLHFSCDVQDFQMTWKEDSGGNHYLDHDRFFLNPSSEGTSQNDTDVNGGNEDTESDYVVFPDRALDYAVHRSMGISQGKKISKEEARSTRSLNLSGGEHNDYGWIENLEGLACFTGLEKLYLDDNIITDVTELRGLTGLKELNLEKNCVQNVDALSGLTNLTYLDLYYNNINDISPLRNLTNLERFDARGNHLMSVEILRNMKKMKKLYLSTNNIQDVSPLAGLTRLTYLSLNENQVNDVSMLGGLTKIHEFCVRDNDIRDISVVLNYPKLYWLEISDNPNLDRSPLKQLSDKVKIK